MAVRHLDFYFINWANLKQWSIHWYFILLKKEESHKAHIKGRQNKPHMVNCKKQHWVIVAVLIDPA